MDQQRSRRLTRLLVLLVALELATACGGGRSADGLSATPSAALTPAASGESSHDEPGSSTAGPEGEEHEESTPPPGPPPAMVLKRDIGSGAARTTAQVGVFAPVRVAAGLLLTLDVTPAADTTSDQLICPPARPDAACLYAVDTVSPRAYRSPRLASEVPTRLTGGVTYRFATVVDAPPRQVTTVSVVAGALGVVPGLPVRAGETPSGLPDAGVPRESLAADPAGRLAVLRPLPVKDGSSLPSSEIALPVTGGGAPATGVDRTTRPATPGPVGTPRRGSPGAPAEPVDPVAPAVTTTLPLSRTTGVPPAEVKIYPVRRDGALALVQLDVTSSTADVAPTALSAGDAGRDLLRVAVVDPRSGRRYEAAHAAPAPSQPLGAAAPVTSLGITCRAGRTYRLFAYTTAPPAAMTTATVHLGWAGDVPDIPVQ